MNTALYDIAKDLVAKPKGILATDLSINSANKKLKELELDTTEENRRRYREVLIGTNGIGKYMSGIILSEESLYHKDSSGRSFVNLLGEEGVIVGVKVDRGLVDLPNFPEEKVTQGLDDLGERLAKYYKDGARFTKWRAVFNIGKGIPTFEGINANVHTLARYAALSQANGLVPVVEPEVIYKGTHTIEMSKAVTTVVLNALFNELQTYRVDLKGVILKTSMVLAGKDNAEQTKPKEVAAATVDVLKEAVPEEVPGVVFLSGGQSSEQAITNLSEISKIETPWPTTFSYLRAIEDPPLFLWKGDDKKIPDAQKILLEKLEECSRASMGKL